ncbi:MAG: hypothetical protein JXQ99_01495 [Hyphomicrobiaceae bacterium]
MGFTIDDFGAVFGSTAFLTDADLDDFAFEAIFLVVAFALLRAGLAIAFLAGDVVFGVALVFLAGALATAFLTGAVFFAAGFLPVAGFGVDLPTTVFFAAAFLGALFDGLATACRLAGAFFAAGLVGRFNVLVLLTTTSGGPGLLALVSSQRRIAPACTRQRSQVKGFDAGS